MTTPSKHSSRAINFSISILKTLGLLCLGAVTSLIFPPFVNAFAGYLALIAFLCLLFNKEHNKKQLFALTYTFGFGFFAIGFSWINNALLIDEEKFITFIPLVICAIGFFFGLFWAIPAIFIPLGRNIYTRMILFCCIFTLMEWIRSFIFTGFPWNLLGTALSFDYRLIQPAAYIGTYGLSLLLLIFCCGICLTLLSLKHKTFYRGSILFIFIPIIAIILSQQNLTVSAETTASKPLTIRLVQPSIPQTFKWHPALLYRNFRQYIDLTRSKPLDDIDLVVWGETATPYDLDHDTEHLEELTAAIPPHGFLATGILRLGMENGERLLYNSLYILNNAGEIKDYYDKSHLVPFGEYLPFRDHLPDFMTPVANIVGELGKGEKQKPIRVSGLPTMSGAICYESIFPKETINPQFKSEILLIVANDGWYGISAGPYQHLSAAQMRAVEEGITVLRSANTGISAVINDKGKILSSIPLNEVATTDTILPSQLSHPTMYGKSGNSIPLRLLMLLLVLALILNKNISHIKK